jgi:predicted nucleic acid-binding Zn ribbon protein
MEKQDVQQEDDDRELPDPSDMDDHDEPDLLPCPNCRKMINEDADWCHHCKQYVMHETARSKWRSIVVGAILATMVLAALAWFFSR